MANKKDISQTCPLNCPQCGSGNVSSSIEPHSFTYGRGEDAAEITLELPVLSCSNCSFTFLNESAEELKHNAVCRHLGVMNPEEVASVRKKYNLPRNEFAKVSKIGEASLARWEAGSLIQNAAYDQYLYLLGFPDNLARLYKKRALEKPLSCHAFSKSTISGLRMINEGTKEFADFIERKKNFQLHPHKEVA